MSKPFDFDCNICKDNYDDDDKRPLIGSCGHTLCMECVENLRSPNRTATSRCPVCNTSHAFKVRTVNFQLVEFMKRKSGTSNEINKISKNDETMMECSGCGLSTTESRMAVCETCGVGTKVLQVESNGRIIISNQLKLKKYVLCGCCILEKHKNHETISLLAVELDTLAKEFSESCSANIEIKSSNNFSYWMQSAVDQISESLRKMSNKDDAKLVADAMNKIVLYSKPISSIITACEEEYERRTKMSGLWLDVMSKFLSSENAASFTSQWKDMRNVLVEVIDNLEENSEAVDGQQWDHILNLILHEKNHPLPRPPMGDASYSQYSHY